MQYCLLDSNAKLLMYYLLIIIAVITYEHIVQYVHYESYDLVKNFYTPTALF